MMKNYCALFITITYICPSAIHAEKFNPYQYGNRYSYETEQEFSIRMQRERDEQEKRKHAVQEDGNNRTRNVQQEELTNFIWKSILATGIAAAGYFTYWWYAKKTTRLTDNHRMKTKMKPYLQRTLKHLLKQKLKITHLTKNRPSYYLKKTGGIRYMNPSCFLLTLLRNT